MLEGSSQPPSMITSEEAEEANGKPMVPGWNRGVVWSAVCRPRTAGSVMANDYLLESLAFSHWRVLMQGLVQRVLNYFYPRCHLAMVEGDWEALLKQVLIGIQHRMTLPIVMGTLQTAACHPGTHD